MDKLEEHIRKNREDLDKYNPPAGIWEKNQKGIKKRETIIDKYGFLLQQ